VLREARDRQVLVVGDTTVGRVLTGLLRHAGFDPVLATDGDRPVESVATLLDAPALDVLGVVDVADRVRERGTEVAAVASSWPRGEGRDRASAVAPVPDAVPSPIVLETATVRRLVDAECGVGRARTDRAVDAIARAEGGLEVTFEDGVREWFDVVVDVAGTRPSQGTSTPRHGTASLRQYETRIPERPDAAVEFRDVWTEDALVQCVPAHDETGTLLRVTTSASDGWSTLTESDVADLLPDAAADLSSTLADVDPTEVEQRQAGEDGALPRAWGRGRTMRCGVAASPVAPASGLAFSRGIEDAAGVVTALTRSRDTVEATVQAYAADRERATSTARLERAVDDATPARPPSTVADEGLRALANDRRTALAALRESDRHSE
jgi:2-polyprenyl-6-methoxyphenol hydroxylase-like FAD-dependent oxidoreductase